MCLTQALLYVAVGLKEKSRDSYCQWMTTVSADGWLHATDLGCLHAVALSDLWENDLSLVVCINPGTINLHIQTSPNSSQNKIPPGVQFGKHGVRKDKASHCTASCKASYT